MGTARVGYIITPSRNRDGVISSPQFVCVSACLSVCLSVNKIPAKRMHQIGRIFHRIAAYRNGSGPIEIENLWLKIKVTMPQLSSFFFIILC